MSLRFPKKATWRLQRTLGNHGHIPRLKRLLLHSNLYVHIKESKPVIGLKIYSNTHDKYFWQHARHCSSHDRGRNTKAHQRRSTSVVSLLALQMIDYFVEIKK